MKHKTTVEALNEIVEGQICNVDLFWFRKPTNREEKKQLVEILVASFEQQLKVGYYEYGAVGQYRGTWELSSVKDLCADMGTHHIGYVYFLVDAENQYSVRVGVI